MYRRVLLSEAERSEGATLSQTTISNYGSSDANLERGRPRFDAQDVLWVTLLETVRCCIAMTASPSSVSALWMTRSNANWMREHKTSVSSFLSDFNVQSVIHPGWSCLSAMQIVCCLPFYIWCRFKFCREFLRSALDVLFQDADEMIKKRWTILSIITLILYYSTLAYGVRVKGEYLLWIFALTSLNWVLHFRQMGDRLRTSTNRDQVRVPADTCSRSREYSRVCVRKCDDPWWC